jgi:hypothetical protein
MKHLLIPLLVIWIIPYSYSQSVATEDISPAASFIVYEDLFVSWTIGENLIDFSVLSPELSDKNDYGKLSLKDGTLIQVYPTVAREYINIVTESIAPVELNARLMDLKGNSLKVKKLWSHEEILKISDLAAGMYILQITDRDMQDMKMVKIIKQ